MRTVAAVLGGLVAGGLAVLILHRPLLRRAATLDAEVARGEAEIARLAPVRVQVEAYQRAREQFRQDVEWIEAETAQSCPLPLAGLDPELVRGVRLEGLTLDRSSFALLARVASPAAREEVVALVRAQPWARDVEAGADEGSLDFGLLARVDLSSCAAPAAGPRGGEP
jgi:hypothetical protein